MFEYASRVAVVVAWTVVSSPLAHANPTATVGVNVVLSAGVTDSALEELRKHGRVRDVIASIRGVTLQTDASELPAIQALPFVEAAELDVARAGSPIDTVPVDTLGATGGNMWNLDVIDVTDHGVGRTATLDGTGVWVAVVDSGLLDTWRQYFPQERIATQLAIAFGGGGDGNGAIASQPNKWEHDHASHGTAVTSAILGFRDDQGRTWNGAAPGATVIPVKVLDQKDQGYTSVTARGIAYVADLKNSGALGTSPVVLNYSIGGGPSALERAAVQHAIASGIIFVSCAGNRGTETMTYPGAYPEVISVGAIGWTGQFVSGGAWWREDDVPDPTMPSDYYVPAFSSRELTQYGQQLDVIAPGTWIVAPWQENSGKPDITYVEGTSFAAPLVSGIAAMMLQKNPTLQQEQVEAILKGSAAALPPACRTVTDPLDGPAGVCWDETATGAGIATAAAALAATP